MAETLQHDQVQRKFLLGESIKAQDCKKSQFFIKVLHIPQWLTSNVLSCRAHTLFTNKTQAFHTVQSQWNEKYCLKTPLNVGPINELYKEEIVNIQHADYTIHHSYMMVVDQLVINSLQLFERTSTYIK